MSAEQIARSLETDILSGSLKPGAELKQGDIAEKYKVSRIPVRDALQLLSAGGLIELVPNKRARVISLNADEIREIVELRVLLESDCLSHSMKKMSSADFDAVVRAYEHSSIDAKTERWATGDWEFHRALYLPARKHRQLQIIEDLRRTCRIHIAAYGVLPTRTSDWLEDHRDLVEACRSRDTDAAVNVLRAHITNAGETLLAAMPHDGGG